MDGYAVKGDKEWVWPDPSGTCVSVFKNPLTMDYPFTPKSNKFLVPGHFWGYELPDGRWGAARMLGIGPRREGRMSMIAATHAWVGDAPPTAADIESVPFVYGPGSHHIRNISEFTDVLGWASTDGLEFPEVAARLDPPVEVDGVMYDGATGYIGFPLELTTPEQTDLLEEQTIEAQYGEKDPTSYRRFATGGYVPVRLFDARSTSMGSLYYAALDLAFDRDELSDQDQAAYLHRMSRKGSIFLELTPRQIAHSAPRLDALAAKRQTH